MENRNALVWIFLLAICFSLSACSVKEDAENIVDDITTDNPSGEIIVLKDEFNPGEEIRLAYTMESDSLNSGTIKLVSSDNSAAGGNEVNNASGEEKAFNKNIGSMTFTAPSAPGRYEISMYTKDLDGSSSDGMDEIASVTIEVIDPNEESKSLDATMEIPKESYSPGENINVTYTAPSAWDNTAWIGIVPSIVEHGNERENFKNNLEYKNLSGSKGELTFKAPMTPGVYDLRMHNSNKDGMEVEDIRIIVK